MSRRSLFPGCAALAFLALGTTEPAFAQGVPPGPAPATSPGPATAPAVESPPDSLPLARAVDLFRRRNLRLVAGRHSVSAARADAVAAGLITNPVLSFGAQVLAHGAITGGKEELSVMLSQRLPITGYAGLRRDAATAVANAEEAAFAAEAWQLLGELKQAYLGVQRAQLESEVLGAGLRDLDQVQRILDERAKAGAIPAYDRLRLEVERGGLRARLSRTQIELISARAALTHTIGAAPSELSRFAVDPPAEPAGVPDTGLLVQQALARRPELRAAHLQSVAGTLSAGAARRRYVPEPELGIGYTRFLDVPDSSPSSGGAALVSLALPLPVFDHGQGTIRGYEERTRAAGALASETRQRIEREVTFATARLAAARDARHEHEAHVLTDVQNVRRIAEVTYREGKATILELLDAYSSSLRAQEQALDLRMLSLSAALDLERAVGP